MVIDDLLDVELGDEFWYVIRRFNADTERVEIIVDGETYHRYTKPTFYHLVRKMQCVEITRTTTTNINLDKNESETVYEFEDSDRIPHYFDVLHVKGENEYDGDWTTRVFCDEDEAKECVEKLDAA